MTPAMFRRLALIFCLSCVGCSVLSPVPDRSRFFNLTAMSPVSGDRDTPASSAAAAAGPVYGLGPVKLPAYLDRTELVTRVSPAEITYSTTDRWAEPLATSFSAVLLQDLSTLLDTHRIFLYPRQGGERVDYQIEVNVSQFDSDRSGNTRLVARWRVKDVRTVTYLVTKETTVAHSRAPGDGSATVAALSDAVRDLSQEIAESLRRLPEPAAPSTTAKRRK